MGSNMIKVNDNVFELADEIHEAMSSTGYSDKTMKKESDLMSVEYYEKWHRIYRYWR